MSLRLDWFGGLVHSKMSLVIANSCRNIKFSFDVRHRPMQSGPVFLKQKKIMKIKLLEISLFALLFIGSLHSFAQEAPDEISIHIERIKSAFAAILAPSTLTIKVPVMSSPSVKVISPLVLPESKSILVKVILLFPGAG